MRFIFLVFYPFSSQLTIELELVKCFLLNEQKNMRKTYSYGFKFNYSFLNNKTNAVASHSNRVHKMIYTVKPESNGKYFPVRLLYGQVL